MSRDPRTARAVGDRAARLIEIDDATILTPSGRPLFDGLNMRLSREHVALVGRNGVGKSTFLAVLAGELSAEREESVNMRSRPHFVRQVIDASEQGARGVASADGARVMSHGELRRLALDRAKSSGAEILLLDEPTEDLDDAGVEWLKSWLRAWPGCLMVASHDRRLLSDFRHFFVVSETGCRYFFGSLSEIDVELARTHRESEQRYVRSLNQLAAHEEHTVHVARRKARKKRYGRCSEIDRATPRIRLNQKRDHAQVGHGRAAQIREERLEATRQWSKATRRAVGVTLSLDLPVPALPIETGQDWIVLSKVSARTEGRSLFASLDLRIARPRLAIVGPNGAGKTTLLEIMLGRRAPATGSVSCDLSKIGSIAQGGSDWMLDDSLLSLLLLDDPSRAPEDLAKLLVLHRFPLALAERPLRTLSPGERARAALIRLYRRAPPIELLVLDEPTFSLDLVAQRAMIDALRAWPGGLVVASHDRAFLSAIGVTDYLELGRD